MSAHAWKRRRNKPKCDVYEDAGVCGQRVANYGDMCERHLHPAQRQWPSVTWRVQPRSYDAAHVQRLMNEAWADLEARP